MSHFTFECVLYFVDYGSIDQYVSCRGISLVHVPISRVAHCAVFPIAKLTLSSLWLAMLQLPHSFRQWFEVSSPLSAEPGQASHSHVSHTIADNWRKRKTARGRMKK